MFFLRSESTPRIMWCFGVSKAEGGGVGKPSGEISLDAPQVQSEVAQLSEESLEDATVARQRVPPEYQNVFDRLYQRTDP